MRAMMTAFAAMIVIAVAADFVLDRAGFSSEERQSASSVRID